MRPHEGVSDGDTKIFLHISLLLLWIIAPLCAWCILSVQEFETIDHVVGVVGSLIFLTLIYALFQVYRERKTWVLLAFMPAPLIPILAYVYRVIA